MGLKEIKLLFKTIILVLLLTVSTMVSAGSVWDGTVSAARYGLLPQTGMYAASNAFPQNTMITVTNPDTGKSVDVMVLERLEDNNLFLVLSSDAAESVGLGYGDIFHGNISEQLVIGPGTEDDYPYNPDPDVNPSALSGGYSELALIQEYIDNELGGVDESLIIPDKEPESEVSEITTVSDDPISDITVPEAELVEGAEDKPDIPIIVNMPNEDVYNNEPDKLLPVPDMVDMIPENIPESELTEVMEDDIPLAVGMSNSVPLVITSFPGVSDHVPELPVPEEDTPVITSMNMEILEKTEDEISVTELPELPIIIVEEVLSDEKPLAVTMTADVVEVEDSEDISLILPLVVQIEKESEPAVVEDEAVPAVTEPVIESLPAEELSIDVEVVLEPSDPRPPVVDDTEVPEASVEEVYVVPEPAEVVRDEISAAATYNLTRVLAEDSYYLQLGAYREQYSALDLAGSLGGMYPVTVFISDSSDSLNYKVMVGPLGQDESGAVLYSFRSSGYPDAFLRKGL